MDILVSMIVIFIVALTIVIKIKLWQIKNKSPKGRTEPIDEKEMYW